MTRPRSPVRVALLQVFDHGVGDQRLTWRAMAAKAGVGFDVARRTAEAMAGAGQLVVVGTVREPGVCRPMRLYALPVGPTQAGGALGADLVRCWAGVR